MSLSKNINPSLVLVQPMKTGLFITKRLLMGLKESNQTNKQTNNTILSNVHKIGGAHLQCVNNHYAKFEYKLFGNENCLE